ncbi:MAG TPA: SH3 domain-containing protein [Geobacteraceae bacterium]
MRHLAALILIAGLALVAALPAKAQPARPFSGCGVVVIHPLDPERRVAMAPIPFYRNPGVGRIGEISVENLPGLPSILTAPADEFPLAVMAKRGTWLLIAYDDAGREGWVELARWWDYTTWETFLKGRAATLLPGLKKGAYVLRAGPGDGAAQTGALSGPECLRIIEVVDGWANVIADNGLTGWLAWRDGDGRFLISLGGNSGIQKH